MKALTTLLVLVVSLTSWGQQTKKITYKSESPPYNETYYVFKDNPEIKHGDYKKTYRNFSAHGLFDNGKKVGVWEFTGSDGKIEQRIDFTSNKVTNLKPGYLSEGYWIKDGDTYKEVMPDEPPIFIGGNSWFYYYLWTLLRYPADARRNGIEGKVYISATITKEGKMIDEKVEKGPGYGLNEEALRVFQQIPDDWIPAKVNGETVDIRIMIPVTFKLG
jgi:periplasmic protein TonB